VPGSDQLVVLSTRDHSRSPWLVDLAHGAPPRKISVDAGDLSELTVSPDGSHLVVKVDGGGLRVVGLGDAGAGTLRTLTDDPTDSRPSFWRGGREVLFQRDIDGGATQIFAVSIDGGAPRVVLGRGNRAPGGSPAGERFVYLGGAKSRSVTPMIYDARSGAHAPLSALLEEGNYAAPAFSPDGRRVALVRGGRELVEVDVASGAITRRTGPATDSLERAFYARDDLFAVRMSWVGDLWMADGPF
jgi:Tol biopolymer transport system component